MEWRYGVFIIYDNRSFHYRWQRLKEQEKAAMSPTGENATASTAEPTVNPFTNLPVQSPTASADLFGAGMGGMGVGATRPSDDLLALSGPNPFVGSVHQPQPTAAVNPFSSPTGAGAPWPNTGRRPLGDVFGLIPVKWLAFSTLDLSARNSVSNIC